MVATSPFISGWRPIGRRLMELLYAAERMLELID